MELEKRQLTLRDILTLKYICKDAIKESLSRINIPVENFISADFEWTENDEIERRIYKKNQRLQNRKNFYIRKKSILNRASLVNKDNFIQYLKNYNEFYVDEKFFDSTFYDARDQKKESNELIKKLYRGKKDKGIYIFYHRVPLKDGNEAIIPLYAGKTVSFLARFNQYQNINEGTWYSKYFDSIMEDVLWEFDVFFSLVVIPDYEKTKLKEHQFLHDLNPMFNVA